MKRHDEPENSRRGMMFLHWVHVIFFVLLVFTGLLLFSPSLRLLLTGGYAQSIGKIHEYAGVISIPILTFYGMPLFKEYRDFNLWKKIHSQVLILTGSLFVISGFVMWFHKSLPVVVSDISTFIHEVLTFLVLIVLIMHIIVLKKGA